MCCWDISNSFQTVSSCTATDYRRMSHRPARCSALPECISSVVFPINATNYLPFCCNVHVFWADSKCSETFRVSYTMKEISQLCWNTRLFIVKKAALNIKSNKYLQVKDTQTVSCTLRIEREANMICDGWTDRPWTDSLTGSGDSPHSSSSWNNGCYREQIRSI